jgi:sec-independent protein translocase protein TatA
MGAFSPVHLILVLAIALILFGPRKLPEIGQSMGRALRELNRARQDLMNSLHSEMHVEEPAASYADTQAAIEPAGGNEVGRQLPSTAGAGALPYGGEFLPPNEGPRATEAPGVVKPAGAARPDLGSGREDARQ